MPYNPLDWYWTVGSDATKVYSSKLGGYVPAADATYQAWRAAGNNPSSVINEAELGDILAPYYPDVARPTPAAMLDGYQQAQADDIQQHKLIKLLFVMMNDIRVLKGQQPFTVQQARAYVKGLM